VVGNLFVRLAVLLLALPAAAAPAGRGTSPLSLRIETGYLQPVNSDEARGGGVGAGAAYRFTDQLAAIASASQNFVWVRPLTGRARARHALTAVALGASALLDDTPVAPFLELSVVQLIPRSAAGYSYAARTGLGADWRLAPAYAVGLAVRTLTPLDGPDALTAATGIEVAARLVWTL
jgi:hypothetical protein